MENILNQKATNSNSNFMDHLYCHPNEITKQYVHTTTTNENNNNKSNSKAAIAINTDSSSEEGMLQEEVNSLKSMLLFHFDLIQTQAEQLQAKEIELKAQRAECEKLRVRNTQLTGQVADIQQQLEEQMKRNVVIKRTSLPPPPLAKIQCLNENVNNNKGLLLTTISTTTITTASTTTTTTTTSCTTATSIPTIANTTLADKTRMPKLAAVSVNIKKLVNNEVNNKNTITTTAVKNMPTIIKLTPPPLLVKEDKSQTINAKLKEKKSTTTTTTDNIVNNNSNNNKSLSLIKTTEEEREKSVKNKEYSNETEECAVEEKNNSLIKLNDIKEEININDVKRSSSTLSIKTNTLSSETTNCLSSIRSSTSCSSPASSTTLQGKTKRRRVWQVPELATDDSDNSFDSMLDMETRSAGADDTGSGSGSNSSVDCCEREDCSGCSESGSSLTTATANSEQTLKEPQYLYYSVNSPYLSRPWQEEELDGELEDDIAEALKAAEPKLEIPKWTEHDIVPLYNIEGTEDLNDELFAKRHAKLELDEKRRKKWDVQQIREQRRLEKLRKRHCKDELNQGPVIQSFFPLNEDLERICFVETLPVQAFGEPIPMLPHNGEGFLLPWLLKTDGRPLPPPKKATEFYRFGLKKMTRKEEKLWEEYLDEVEDASQDIENKEEKTDIKLESKAEKETEAVEKTDVNAGEVKADEEEEGGVEVTNSICDNKNPTEKGNLRIADCCYAAPTVMLARDCRPCASRTQQRRRLRYSTYIYLTKRRRQLSLSVKTTTIANNINNNSNNLTSTTTSTLASGTKTTSTTTTTSIISISTPTTTTTTSSTTKTNCKNIIKKNSSPSINNKLSTTTTTTTSSRNITNNRKSKEQQQEKIPTTTTTASLNKDNKKNNTYNNSTTTITNNNNLDKTKENTTTTTTTNTATTTLKSSGGVATISNEKSDKTTELTEGTTKILNNSIKSKLRNLRSSSSPCSYISSSNSNSSTILDNTTSTSTATTPTSLSNMTTATTTLVTTTKSK